MAHVKGFDYDIFISYTHDDNYPVGGDGGWVDQFHARLESWLVRRRGLTKLKIWRDKALHGNTPFNQAIQEKIQRSALFFALHSRNYRHSGYCARELEWFFRYNLSRVGGPILDERHRVFNVLLNNLKHDTWPPALRETSGFRMNDAERDDDLGEFLSPRDPRFDRFLRPIVDATEVILAAFESKSSAHFGKTAFDWSGRPARLAHFVLRPRERNELETAVARGDAPVVIVRAIGGQGKTTLVAEWLSQQEEAGSLQFDDVCFFSAYRFGVGFIEFLEFAAESLKTGPIPDNPSVGTLSRMLVQAMKQGRTLLVVDGIERWLREDRTESDTAGGLGALLAEIATIDQPSKLVLTTRATPRALDGMMGVTLLGGESGTLPGLDEREGLLLLERLRVAGQKAEKRECVREVKGHPLAMTVLAGILRKLGKSISERQAVYPIVGSHEDKLRSILTQAEALCGGELEILQAAALCPEDAPAEALAAALDRPQDRDTLTLKLHELSDWGLLALGGSKQDLIQMHPLVREHFSATIPDSKPTHTRLSAHFAAVPISSRARSLSRVSARIWSVEHAAAAGDFDGALDLLLRRPLAPNAAGDQPDGGIGNLSLSRWFQHYGQSAFELEWTRRLGHGAPP